MNRFLNENANAIVDEMKPAASSSIGKHFAGFLNKAFSNIPVHVWLKDWFSNLAFLGGQLPSTTKTFISPTRDFFLNQLFLC